MGAVAWGWASEVGGLGGPPAADWGGGSPGMAWCRCEEGVANTTRTRDRQTHTHRERQRDRRGERGECAYGRFPAGPTERPLSTVRAANTPGARGLVSEHRSPLKGAEPIPGPGQGACKTGLGNLISGKRKPKESRRHGRIWDIPSIGINSDSDAIKNKRNSRPVLLANSQEKY